MLTTNTLNQSIQIATEQDIEPIINAIVLAFSADPAVRWMYPNPQQFLSSFPKFVQVFGGKAFQYETAYYVEGYLGAALWLPPHVSPDSEALIALLQQTIFEQDQEEVFAVFEQMEHFHPAEPHWYLPLIGMDPPQQGKGHGAALMQKALEHCDRDRLIAYLECSNPTNVAFYERHGFQLKGKISISESLAIYPMMRHPR